MRRVRLGVAATLAVVPLLIAALGPLLMPAQAARGVAFGPDGLLGRDFAGRDVVGQVLAGGGVIVLTSAIAVLVTYLIAVPWGLIAATGRSRALDELLMRPLDVVVAIPSLLLLLLLASSLPTGRSWTLVLVVAAVMVPDTVRVVRALALGPASSPAYEAMVVHRDGRVRRLVGFVARRIAPEVLTDAGVRFVGAIYLVASASFLGIGVDPDAANWGVMVERNRGGLALSPAATVAPALLIVMLAVGLNLLLDELRRGVGGRR